MGIQSQMGRRLGCQHLTLHISVVQPVHVGGKLLTNVMAIAAGGEYQLGTEEGRHGSCVGE